MIPYLSTRTLSVQVESLSKTNRGTCIWDTKNKVDMLINWGRVLGILKIKLTCLLTVFAQLLLDYWRNVFERQHLYEIMNHERARQGRRYNRDVLQNGEK